MIKAKEAKKEVIKEMEKFLLGEGFQLNKKDNLFEKRNQVETQCVYFLFNDYGYRLFVEPWWGLRLRAFSDLYK